MNETNSEEEARRWELAQEVLLLQKRLELKRQNGLAFYSPHPGQDRFHKAAGGAVKHRMVRCGNRYGKSTMGCAEDLAWMRGERIWYPKGSVERTLGIPQRPVKGLVITTDWDKVHEIWTNQNGAFQTLGKIWQMAPQGFITKTKRNHSGAIQEMVAENGSNLSFDTVKSFKMNGLSSESSDWDFIHVDEPCPKDMFVAAARGLMDRDGSSWFTLTPIGEFWINDMFFPQPGIDPVFKFKPGSIWAMQGNTKDNPYLPREAIENFASLLTPQELECRLAGIPLELSGLVYKEFSYAKHVLKEVPKGWKDYQTPPKDYIIYVAIDPHPQTPHAVLFVAVSPLGQCFIYDEIFLHCGAAELAKMVLFKLQGYYHATVKCDPIAWIEDPVTFNCMATAFAEQGLYVEKASKAKAFGILKMKTEFRKDGFIYVAPNLGRFLFEVNRYCYDDKELPVDKDDHMMECMYRLFINNPIWFDPDKGDYPIEHQPIVGASFDLKDLEIKD